MWLEKDAVYDGLYIMGWRTQIELSHSRNAKTVQLNLMNDVSFENENIRKKMQLDVGNEPYLSQQICLDALSVVSDKHKHMDMLY